MQTEYARVAPCRMRAAFRCCSKECINHGLLSARALDCFDSRLELFAYLNDASLHVITQAFKVRDVDVDVAQPRLELYKRLPRPCALRV